MECFLKNLKSDRKSGEENQKNESREERLSGEEGENIWDDLLWSWERKESKRMKKEEAWKKNSLF